MNNGQDEALEALLTVHEKVYVPAFVKRCAELGFLREDTDAPTERGRGDAEEERMIRTLADPEVRKALDTLANGQ